MTRLTPRRMALAVALALAMAAVSCVAPRTRPAAAPPPRSVRQEPSVPSQATQLVVEAHNARRAKAGLGPLVLNPELEAAALEHAQDMATRGKMGHRGSDGSSPFDRMKRHGYSFQAAAENVAFGFNDVESVMVGWMKSPGHKRNILGKFSEIGVGRAIGKDGASYWCVTFGTPSGG